jgi:hypothetical protein
MKGGSLCQIDVYVVEIMCQRAGKYAGDVNTENANAR